jgi:hypothetical protein
MKFYVSLALVFNIHLVLARPFYAKVVSSDTVLNSTYDFVILGGGLSALTVADRLSEDPSGLSKTSRHT